MAIRRIRSGMDVVTAAKIRIRNAFRNGVPVYMSFSGGKDSLSLGQLALNLIRAGEIDPSLLTVQFVDEEAIFPCIEETVKDWRRKFLYAGAKFDWLCVEVRHFNCFNELSEDESFICWDKQKRDVWVRQPPPFAVTEHPLLKPRKDNYQSFMPRLCMDGVTLTGVRAAESVQRLQYMANMNLGGKGLSRRRQLYPIYDWTTNDVWLYLRNEGVDIPKIYFYLWQTGTTRNQLRVSQFFSVDTAKSLVQMNEYYPDLMERIIKREPNAYLAALYWDSEMFGRRTRARRQAEKDAPKKDYKALLTAMFADRPRYFNTPHKMNVARHYRSLFLKVSLFAADIAQFLRRLKALGGAAVRTGGANTGGGSDVQPVPVNIPWESREKLLDRLERDLYRDFMALDTYHIASGAMTATQIRAAYEQLNSKADQYEYCALEFLYAILAIAGIDDKPSFSRSAVVNVQEEIQTVLQAAEYMDDETVTRKILTVMGMADQVETVLQRKAAEDAERLNNP